MQIQKISMPVRQKFNNKPQEPSQPITPKAPATPVNQPAFSGMHIIRVNLNKFINADQELVALATTHPRKAQKMMNDAAQTAIDATTFIQEIHTPYSRIAPESVISVKDAGNSAFAINFTEGMEDYEKGFEALIKKEKDLYDPNLVSYEKLEEPPNNLTLADFFYQKTRKPSPIGFRINSQSGEY